MTNEISTPNTTSTEKPKRVKRIDWKVDNLRHISDHGSLVQFADEAKAKLIREIFSSDCTARIDAGQSHIEITTLGHVTETRLFLSVGSYRHNTIHYKDGQLSYKFEESKDSEAYSYLRQIVFGDKATGYRSTTKLENARQYGENADKFRHWFKSYSFVFFGENGLRAQAIKSHVARAKANTDAKEYDSKRAKMIEDNHNTRDYAKERKEILSHADYLAKSQRTRLTTLAEIAEKISNATNAAEFPSDYNTRQHITGLSEVYYPKQELFFPEKAKDVSPAIIRPNYTATVDGEKITLSSGLVCPFTYSRLICWLKGECEEIRTQYGTVQKVEASTPEFAPVVLLRCGCHIIDAAKINEELSELLKPSHEVKVTDGTPRLTLTDETLQEFKARCIEAINQSITQANARRSQIAHDARQRLQNHKNEQANHATRAAELAEATAKAKEEHEKAQRDEEATKGKFIGSTVDQLAELSKQLINALLPKEF